jgi:cysteine desulfurase/selenocysteine lyase
VRALVVDFLACSAHKMLGLPGTGVLYCRRRVHGELGPFLPGAGAGLHVDRSADGQDRLTVTSIPAGLECGTPNLPGIVALAAAVDVLQEVGLDRIAVHGDALTRYLIDGLRTVPRVRLLPGVAGGPEPVGQGIVAFGVDGVPATELGAALAAEGCYLRAGLPNPWTAPARGSTGPAPDVVAGVLRASVHLYSDSEQVDRFVDLLARLV